MNIPQGAAPAPTLPRYQPQGSEAIGPRPPDKDIDSLLCTHRRHRQDTTISAMDQNEIVHSHSLRPRQRGPASLVEGVAERRILLPSLLVAYPSTQQVV